MVSIRRAATITAALAVALAACSPSGGDGSAAAGGDCTVGVAWATFQEERYGLRDKPGIEAAHALAKRLLHEGRQIKILIPPTPGNEWADEVHYG